eukprot:scaffold118748_cov24-Tisochrysis_lutea.AAC.1
MQKGSSANPAWWRASRIRRIASSTHASGRLLSPSIGGLRRALSCLCVAACSSRQPPAASTGTRSRRGACVGMQSYARESRLTSWSESSSRTWTAAGCSASSRSITRESGSAAAAVARAPESCRIQSGWLPTRKGSKKTGRMCAL